MKTCLCCFDEVENGSDICKSCSEGWVCKECLPEYRKHWGNQCCICKKGDRNIVQNNDEPTPLLFIFFYYFILSFALTIPAVSCYFWLKYPNDDSDDTPNIIISVVMYEAVVISLNVFGIAVPVNYLYLILFNSWVVLGNCIYIAFFHITGTYGNFIFYNALVFTGCLVFVIPFVFLFLIYECIRKTLFRIRSPSNATVSPMDNV